MASRYDQKFFPPTGFCDILHDFTSELLFAQPDDILEFAANYFQSKYLEEELEREISIEKTELDSDDEEEYVEEKEEFETREQGSDQFEDNEERCSQKGILQNRERKNTDGSQTQLKKKKDGFQKKITIKKSPKILHEIENNLALQYIQEMYEIAIQKALEIYEIEYPIELQEEFLYEYELRISQYKYESNDTDFMIRIRQQLEQLNADGNLRSIEELIPIETLQ